MYYSDQELATMREVLTDEDWSDIAWRQRASRKKTTDWKNTTSCVREQNRRARRLGLEGRVTLIEWEVILAKYGYKCVKCGESHWIQMDHIVPLARFGEHEKENLQPLCRWCHEAKGMMIVDWRPDGTISTP